MSYDFYMKFDPPTTKSFSDGMKVVSDTDTNTGQDDGVADTNQNPEFKSSAGWMRLVYFEYGAAASAQVGAGVSTGNVTEATLKVTKLTGPNTAIAYRCLYERTPINVHVRVQNRKGGGENKTIFTFLFEDAVFTRITTKTGEPTRGQQGSVTTHAVDDLTEVDTYELVYQAVNMETGNKKKVRLSAMHSK